MLQKLKILSEECSSTSSDRNGNLIKANGQKMVNFHRKKYLPQQTEEMMERLEAKLEFLEKYLGPVSVW